MLIYTLARCHFLFLRRNKGLGRLLKGSTSWTSNGPTQPLDGLRVKEAETHGLNSPCDLLQFKN